MILLGVIEFVSVGRVTRLCRGNRTRDGPLGRPEKANTKKISKKISKKFPAGKKIERNLQKSVERNFQPGKRII